MSHTPKAETEAPQAPQKAKPERTAQPEAESSEPEMIVIPLEEMEPQTQKHRKTKHSS